MELRGKLSLPDSKLLKWDNKEKIVNEKLADGPLMKNELYQDLQMIYASN